MRDLSTAINTLTQNESKRAQKLNNRSVVIQVYCCPNFPQETPFRYVYYKGVFLSLQPIPHKTADPPGNRKPVRAWPSASLGPGRDCAPKVRNLRQGKHARPACRDPGLSAPQLAARCRYEVRRTLADIDEIEGQLRKAEAAIGKALTAKHRSRLAGLCDYAAECKKQASPKNVRADAADGNGHQVRLPGGDGPAASVME
jgi:hypothetical protein